MEDLSVMDNAAAHTGTQRNGDKALAAPAAAYIVFRQSSAVGVVFYVQGQIAELMEQPPERHIAQGKIAGIQNGPAADLHGAGTAHTNRDNIL